MRSGCRNTGRRFRRFAACAHHHHNHHLVPVHLEVSGRLINLFLQKLCFCFCLHIFCWFNTLEQDHRRLSPLFERILGIHQAVLKPNNVTNAVPYCCHIRPITDCGSLVDLYNLTIRQLDEVKLIQFSHSPTE